MENAGCILAGLHPASNYFFKYRLFYFLEVDVGDVVVVGSGTCRA